MANEVEKNLPCLLDKLIDETPGQAASGRRKVFIGKDEYRRAVLRDLKWLLNSPQYLQFDRCLTHSYIDEPTLHDKDERLRSSENPEGYLYPNVRTSVLNYGTRSLSGMRSEMVDDLELENELRESIIAFEPRIDPKKLRVKLIQNYDQPGKLAFEIRGELWTKPQMTNFSFRSELDLESGAIQLPDDL